MFLRVLVLKRLRDKCDAFEIFTSRCLCFLTITLAMSTSSVAIGSPKLYRKQFDPSYEYHTTMKEKQVQAASVARSYFRHLPNGGDVNLNRLNFSVANANEIVVASKVFGAGFDDGSYAGVLIDLQTMSIRETVQVKATYNGSSAKVLTWVNDKLQNSQQVDLIWNSTTANSAKVGVVTRGVSGDIVDCLSALGISTAVALILISTCTSACAVTVGAGCLVCIAGFTALGGASVGKCLHKG